MPPSPRLSALRYAGAAFLLVALPGLLHIRRWAMPAPISDQWDGELLTHYLPWITGNLSSANFFEPYNGINLIVTKRLLDQFLLIINGGNWDPLLQMVIGLVLTAIACGLLAFVCRLYGNHCCARVLLAWLGILALVPIHWENIIWGFQTAIHLYFLFSVAAFAAASSSSRNPGNLWIAIACAILASLSFGAAFLPALCILAVLFLLPTDRSLGLSLVTLALVAVGSVMLHISLIDFSGSTGRGIRIDLGVITRALSWPLSPFAPWAAVLSLPVMIHAFWCFLHGRGTCSRMDASSLVAIRFLTMLWFWSYSQQLLVRLLRDGTESRHLELLWFVWLAPLLIGVILWSCAANRRQVFYGVFLLTFGAMGTAGAFATKALTLQDDINTHATSKSIEFLALYELRNGRDRAAVMHDHDDHLDSWTRYMLDTFAFDLIENEDTRSILPSYYEDSAFYSSLKALRDSPHTHRLLLTDKPPHNTVVSKATRTMVVTSSWWVPPVILACLFASFIWPRFPRKTHAVTA